MRLAAVFLLTIHTLGCDLVTGENEMPDWVSGAWEATSDREVLNPGISASASGISYIMQLSYGARVSGILEISTDTTGHPKLLDGFLRYGSPDMLT